MAAKTRTRTELLAETTEPTCPHCGKVGTLTTDERCDPGDATIGEGSRTSVWGWCCECEEQVVLVVGYLAVAPQKEQTEEEDDAEEAAHEAHNRGEER